MRQTSWRNSGDSRNRPVVDGFQTPAICLSSYLSRSGPVNTAWAAASRATGTRNGEHDT